MCLTATRLEKVDRSCPGLSMVVEHRIESKGLGLSLLGALLSLDSA